MTETYQVMYETYSRIFQRCGLDFRAVQADTGSIGGHASHEFHVLAASGEDAIAFSTGSDYAANVELAEALPRAEECPAPSEELRLVDTPDARTIADLVEQFGQPIERTVKTLVVAASEEAGGGLVVLLVRGDHELECRQGREAPRGSGTAADGRGGRHPGRRRRRPRLPRSPEPADPLHRGPHGRRHCGLQRRGQCGRQALLRPQLGPRSAPPQGG